MSRCRYIMLPNSVGRSNSTTEDSLRAQKFPSSDFNSHFVIKGRSSSPLGGNNNQSSIVSTKESSSPAIITADCHNLPNSSSTNDNSTPSNIQNDKLVIRNLGPPLPSTSSSSTSVTPQRVTMSSQSQARIEVEVMASSSSPLSVPPSTPRRSTSMQHPFMMSPRRLSTSSTSPSSPTGKMLATTAAPRTNIISLPDSPMDFSYQPVSTFCFRRNKMGYYEINEDCSDEGNGSHGGGGAALSDYETILKVCGQRSPIPLEMICNGLKTVEKIGEGVYGEVYSGTFRYFSQCSWVYKVVAIAGDTMVNGERQKGFLEVLPELVVSQELSELKGVLKQCYTDGFAFMKNARIAKGKYPWSLLRPWEMFHKKYESDNDRPNFPPDQLYMVLEFEFAGQDIESLSFRDARQTLSIVLQVAHILAVGEFALEFEHRDLHWGNILVQNWNSPTIRYLINNETFHVPSIGIKAAVIDFTISRIKTSKTNTITYLDLQDDEEQFLGTGDHQFDIYRMMRDHNRNDWRVFCPKSNIFWLHYLANKLYVKGQYTTASNTNANTNRKSAHHVRAIRKLKEFSHMILEHGSAKDFVFSKECNAYRDFLGSPIRASDPIPSEVPSSTPSASQSQ